MTVTVRCARTVTAVGRLSRCDDTYRVCDEGEGALLAKIVSRSIEKLSIMDVIIMYQVQQVKAVWGLTRTRGTLESGTVEGSFKLFSIQSTQK